MECTVGSDYWHLPHSEYEMCTYSTKTQLKAHVEQCQVIS